MIAIRIAKSIRLIVPAYVNSTPGQSGRIPPMADN